MRWVDSVENFYHGISLSGRMPTITLQEVKARGDKQQQSCLADRRDKSPHHKTLKQKNVDLFLRFKNMPVPFITQLELPGVLPSLTKYLTKKHWKQISSWFFGIKAPEHMIPPDIPD